jgi:cell shape-determining protein MreC
MRLIIFLLILLPSCTSSFHLKKAVKKDPTILKERIIIDTLTIEKLDSIPYVVNDTIRYTYFKTFTDTLVKTKYKYIENPLTRQEVRLKYKLETKYNRLQARNERLRVKTQNKLNIIKARLAKRLNQTIARQENKRKFPWWLVTLIIGLIIGFFLKFFIKAIVG